MKCKLAEQVFPEYIEGTLPPNKVRQLELHLANCAHCQREVETFEKAIRLASNLPIEYPQPEAWKAFWPSLRMEIEQSHCLNKSRFPLWVEMHRWKIAGSVCILIFLLSLWGIFNSDLLKPPMANGTSALDDLISQSFLTAIPAKQLQEQLNREFQGLDAPLVWGDESSLGDEIHPQESIESNDLFNQLFQVIRTEIDQESFGHEEVTDFVPSIND